MISHLARGLAILGERWWSGPWILEGKTALDQWVRRGLRALLTMAVFALVSTSGWLFAAAVLVVIVKALRAATKAAKGQPQKQTTPAVEPAGEDGPPVVSAAELVALAHELIATAPGVHLSTLAAVLTQQHGGTWNTGAVRALCGAYSIPVRPSVRDASKRVSPGLHREDLPPLSQPLPGTPVAPPVGVVAAGQPATTPGTTGGPTTPTTPTVTTHGGVRVIARDDPDNPARTHVTVVHTQKKGA